MSKGTITVSFKLEDIPMIIETMEKLQQENKQLKSIINTLIKEYNLEPTEYVENLLKGDSNE